MRKVMIVFEDTGEVPGGQGFNCYLSGECERIGKTNVPDLGPAEFWALKCFEIVGNLLVQTGAATSQTKKPKDGLGH